MNYTLFDLFLNAYNGNSFAQLQIVQRFQPLLKKYAALLKYEDAYSDLQLYLLELLHTLCRFVQYTVYSPPLLLQPCNQ